MARTFELSADVLDDLDAAAMRDGTSPDSYLSAIVRNYFATAPNPAPKTVAEQQARIDENAAEYQRWWNALSTDEQRAFEEKWDHSAALAEQGRTVPAAQVFARLRARHAAGKPLI